MFIFGGLIVGYYKILLYIHIYMYKYKMFCNVICMNTTYIFLEGYYIPIPHPHLSSQVPNAAEGMQPSVLA